MTQLWPMVPLASVASPVHRPEVALPGKMYRQVGVRLWGQGAYEREPIDGARTRYRTLSRVEKDDIIVNKIWARNGSVAVISDAVVGCYVSAEFPTFALNQEKLDPRWFHWLVKTRSFWERCDDKSRGTTGKNRIRPDRFLEIEVPLPSRLEQRRVVTLIEELAAKLSEATKLQRETQTDIQRMLLSVYTELTNDTPFVPMGQVAPLVRRPVKVELSRQYDELGIRSFGKGTFHKPPVDGASLRGKKVFSIEAGDLLFNIVFAWEGAVAVARDEDHGLVGSHRFLTCVPKDGLATSRFLCFHFLTQRGLQQLGQASPGGAGRNRTLGTKALEGIQVPLPGREKRIWFDAILAKVEEVRRLQLETITHLDAMLPSILDKAFKGEL